jgi:signal peptidase II
MYFIVIIAAIAIDQLVKVIIRTGLSLGEHIPVLGDFLTLTLHFNTGAAFSMMEGRRFILILLPALMIILLIAYIIKERKSGSRLQLLSLSLIVGGGMGNLIDRFAFGKVTDFISVGSFPIFNVADMCVVSGCFLVVISLFLPEIGKRKKSNDDT